MSDVAIKVDAANIQGVSAAFEEMPRKIMAKIIAPAVKKAAGQIAESMKSDVPVRSGAMKQAVGTGKFKLYRSGLLAYEPTGVRRGYGRGVSVQVTTTGTIKLKRKSKKESEAGREKVNGRWRNKKDSTFWKFVDPAKVAEFVDVGRGPIKAGTAKGKKTGKRGLFDAVTGKFFKGSAKGTTGKHFVEDTQDAAGGIAEATVKIEIFKNIQAVSAAALKGS